MSSNEKNMSTLSPDTLTLHYNDWPNAVGFDAAYEEHEPVELVVKGSIPSYAAGTLFRTGIGPRSVTNDDGKVIFKSHHWFDGFSQVHRFQLHVPQDSSVSQIQKVTYNSRLTSDKLIERIRRTGEMDDFTFGARYDPCKSFFRKLQAVFQYPVYMPSEVNNAVTLTINHPGFSSTGAADSAKLDPTATSTLCNRTDTDRFQFIDPETLEATGLATQSRLHPSLTGRLSGAHNETDPETGDIFNFNLDFGSMTGIWRIFKTNAATGKASILAKFQHAPAYLHSIFMTEHFVILCIWNSRFTKAGASILWARNLLDAMYFENNSPATWYVIDRRCPETEGGTGVVATFHSEPFFAFHSVNAYETSSTSGEDNTVDLICDVSRYDDTSVIHHFYMDNLVSSNPKSHERARRLAEGKYDNAQVRLQRYRLPNVRLINTSTSSTTGKVVVEFTASVVDSVELPTINPTRKMKPHRYVYGISNPDGKKSTFVDALIKYDLHTHEAIRWEDRGQTPGEAIFIPAPGEGRDEDDGVLLTVVLNGYTGKSYLLCLNARDMKELGRTEVNGAIGFGFHGTHTKIL